MTNLLLLSSPFRLSIWDLLPMREGVVLLAYARPIPAVVCVVVAGLFLIQSCHYLAKARTERGQGDPSPRRVWWLSGSMILGFVLAAAWIALLGLELRYPDLPASTQTQDSKP